MKSVKVTAFGGPEVLVLSESASLRPSAGQALIKVEAAGVGFVDAMTRQGAYPGLSEPGFTPGIEVAGVVTEVGDGAAKELVGRRVFAMVPIGGYAEQALVDAASLVPLPDTLSASDAVSLGVNVAVAQIACDRAQVAPGERVLVRGAGGGIGVLLTQIAARRGSQVTAITSSKTRGDRLRELGAGEIVDRKSGAKPDGDGFDVIIDPVGGAEMSEFVAQLRPNGRFILCGVVAGLPTPDFGMSLLMNFQKSVSLATFSLNSVSPTELLATFKAAFEAAAKGELRPIVADVLPLGQAAAAHAQLEAGSVFGKLVLTP